MRGRGATSGAGRRRVVWAWLAVAAMIAVIWGFSSDGFSSHSTSRFFRPLVRWLWPDVSYRTLQAIHLGVRKAAHVGEYAALALLAFRAIWLSIEATWARVAAGSLVLVLAVAGVDETRQAFTAARSGSPWDVALDVTGALLALGLLLAVQRGLRRGADPAPARGAGRDG